MPDCPGNHRYDSFLNIIEIGRIGLVFMVPNRHEVVHVNGTAQNVRDSDLRETMAINGRCLILSFWSGLKRRLTTAARL